MHSPFVSLISETTTSTLKRRGVKPKERFSLANRTEGFGSVCTELKVPSDFVPQITSDNRFCLPIFFVASAVYGGPNLNEGRCDCIYIKYK